MLITSNLALSFLFFSDNVAVIRCITCGEMRKEHFSSSPSIFLNSSVCLLLSKNIQRNYKMTDILKNVEDKFTEPSLEFHSWSFLEHRSQNWQVAMRNNTLSFLKKTHFPRLSNCYMP